jgi:predicted DNA-binding transcriptional regulator YafY
MPKTEKPTIRYRIINACFTNRQKRYWTIEELMEKLQAFDLVAYRRTVERDLFMMRHDQLLAYEAPIVYDKREKAYHYSDANFTIERMPLTAEDLEVLTLIINIMQQYKGVKLVDQFEGVVDKLSKVVEHLNYAGKQNILGFEKNPYYKGYDYFDTIYQAILNKQPLRITYRKFNGDKDDIHTLHSYFMKEYKGRWYVLGHSDARHYTITLGLDRINKLQHADAPYKENKVLKPKEYFEHTIGVTLGKGKPEEIELLFSPVLAPYIKTQHLHHTQKTIRDNADGLLITLKLIPNPELLQLLLSYCGDVKVIKPLQLREQFIEKIRKGMVMNENE